MTEEQTTKLTREQLYNEIWEISVSGVTKKYNVPYTEMLKLCKEADIPIPPSGYWTKLRFGKSVTNIPLPESEISEVTLPTDFMPKRIRKTGATVTVAEEKMPDPRRWISETGEERPGGAVQDAGGEMRTGH